MRLAVVCDYVEEGWPSMDLAAEMLVAYGRAHAEVAMVRPPLPRFARALVPLGPPARRFALERAVGRYLAYPAYLWSERGKHQAFHVADHSYAHLVLGLPEQRAGVYCHDLDAFRAGFPGASGEPWRRALARLLLTGLRRASVVFFSTYAVQREILAHGLVPSERLIHAPHGVSPEFSPTANQHDRQWSAQGRYLLHVGHLVPRKNPELLLETFASLAQDHSDLKLVQIGGQWSPEQARALTRFRLESRVLQRRGLSREELAAVYRCAEVTLLPSKAEGFGLPVIESLACGTPVVASDLPVLREVGGSVVEFCPLNSAADWRSAIVRLLDGHGANLDERLGWAARYGWEQHASTIVDAYRALL